VWRVGPTRGGRHCLVRESVHAAALGTTPTRRPLTPPYP